MQIQLWIRSLIPYNLLKYMTIVLDQDGYKYVYNLNYKISSLSITHPAFKEGATAFMTTVVRVIL